MLSVYIMSLLCYRLNNTDNKKKNLFTTLKKTERDKKKLIDTVLKQLRGLVNGTAWIWSSIQNAMKCCKMPVLKE